MLWGVRVANRVRVVGLVTTVLLGAAACTTGSAQSAPSTAPLSPGGTAYPLPSAPTQLPTAPTSAPSTISTPGVQPTGSTQRPAPSSGTTPGSATPTTTPAPSTSATSPPVAPRTSSPATPTRNTATPATTPTLDTAGLSAAEIADRKAIETAWINYWAVGIPLTKRPQIQWKSTLSQFVADPLLSSVLAEAASSIQRGIQNYGSVDHNFYWGPAVNGQKYAVVGDCMDTSRFGTLDVRTHAALTVGLKKDNARISFLRGADNRWRADNIQYLDASC